MKLNENCLAEAQGFALT